MEKLNRFIAVTILELFMASYLPLYSAPEKGAGEGSIATAAAPSVELQPAPAENIIVAAALPEREAPRTTTGYATPEAGGRISLDGVILEIPAGAVDARVAISITALSVTERLAEGLQNVTSGARAYRFEPHGMQFTKEVLVHMPFDPVLSGSETALSNLWTYFYSEESHDWEKLPRVAVDKDAAVITSSTTHFTDMINATLTLPEGPTPIQLDVNSIKNLDAANPAQGVPTPQGLEPGPFGAASFVINLRVPQGRGGATPELALSYSSESANSWMGKGFDIAVPCISVDTRFAIPNYDGNDHYSFMGEDLAKVGTEPDGGLRFRSLKETAFNKIVWNRTADTWQVTSKSGDVSTFGTGSGWIGPDLTDRSKGVYVWYLTQTRDPFGNTVQYDYTQETYTEDSSCCTYLDEITYSGTNAYRISFVLEDKPRDDRRIDGRGRFLLKTAKRLARIDELFGSSPIRSYQFTYAYNEFGQSQLASYRETADTAGTQVFYSYSFDYYALPKHLDSGGTQVGLDGFTEEKQWNIDTQWPGGEQVEDTTSTTSLTVGWNSYQGVELFLWAPFIGTIKLAEFGTRFGLDASYSFSTACLMDINGDGLPDIVRKNGSSLQAIMNRLPGDLETEGAFSGLFTLSGFDGRMNDELQISASLGVSAGLLGLSGAVSGQLAFSDCLSAFSDVNGDGLEDLVSWGGSQYRLFDQSQATPVGAAFRLANWNMATGFSMPVQDDPHKAEYNQSYFLQDPLRQWKSYLSGTVEVVQDADLEGAGTSDGARLFTYPALLSEQTPPLVLGAATPALESTTAYTLQKGDSLYFLLDPGEEYSGDDATWNVKIRYTSVEYLQDTEEAPYMDPPAGTSSALPFSDNDLASIYTASGLKADWWKLDSATLETVYAALVRHACFIPKRIPRDIMDMIIGLCGETAEDRVIDGETVSCLFRDIILSGYLFEKETESFIRIGNGGDDKLKLYLPQLTLADLQEIAANHNRWPDGSLVIPPLDGSTAGSGSHANTITSRISSDAAGAAFGEMVGNADGSQKGILLERMYSTDQPTVLLKTLWLRYDGETGWAAVVDPAAADDVITELSISPLTPAVGAPVTVSLRYRGVKRVYTLSGTTPVIQTITDSVYKGYVTDRVLHDEVFSLDSCRLIPDASWDEFSESDRTNLARCYTWNGTAWQMMPWEDTSEFHVALFILHTGSDKAGSIFDVLPNDDSLRFILLSQSEYDGLSADLKACFDTFIESGTRYYFQKASPPAGILTAMREHRRDAELLKDCYTLAGGIRTLNAASQAAASACFQAAGLFVWSGVERALTYSSDDIYAVSGLIDLPSGASEESQAPRGSQAPALTPKVGSVIVSLLDKTDGATYLQTHYLHAFDSLVDYSAEDIAKLRDNDFWPLEPEEEGPPLPKYNGGIKPFAGGVHGWYYGIWAGCRPWDASKLGQTPVAEPNKPVPPPYCMGMEPNLNEKGVRSITYNYPDNGPPDAQVSNDSWVGKVSEYTASTILDNGTADTTDYTFASVIYKDFLHVIRNGGLAYETLMQRQKPQAAGSLSFIRNSMSDSLDTNMGAGLLSFSTNIGESQQYQALMDINGDRYPDLVQSSILGSSSITVSPGTGEGFGQSVSWGTPVDSLRISRNQTSVLGLGASLGSSSGAISVKRNSKGRATSTSTKPSSMGMALSVGINGTLGSCFQTEGFYDINGDGLPDHLRRDGIADYEVALNTGGSLVSAPDWGSGITDFPPLFDFGGNSTLETQPEGLTHTGTGSFGGTLGVTADALVVSGGLTVGYTGSVDQTFSSLEDVNGDGLLDQVGKTDGEKFFRVKFNLGDCFSATETRIYRPDWEGSTDLRGSITTDLQAIAGSLSGLSIPAGTTVPLFNSSVLDGDNTFGGCMDPFRVGDVLNYTSGSCFSLGGSITVRIPITLIALTFTGGVTGSWATTSATVQFTDIDGDGLPDHIMKLPTDNFLRVKLNSMGEAGLLKTIHLPMGGTYDIEYTRAGNTVQMPQSQWVMSRVTKADGLAIADRGAHSYVTSYKYSEGYYSRLARQFWGFGTVESSYADGSTLSVTYSNSCPHTRGMEKERTLADSSGTLSTTTTVVNDVDVEPGYNAMLPEWKKVMFPSVVSETRYLNDGTSSMGKTTAYGYDSYGNVTDISDSGSLSETGDESSTTIRYLNASTGYFKQHPTSLTVADAKGTLLRWREGGYDSATGALTSLDQYDTPTTHQSWAITYDAYGNLRSVTDPRGARTTWTYDDVVHTFVTATESANTAGGPHYSTASTWSYLWGSPETQTAATGEVMTYAYDLFGRLVSVRSPYDTGTGSIPAVEYSYTLGSLPWSALTSNKVTHEGTEVIQTLVMVDGLGRELVSAKQGEVRQGTVHVDGWNLSGAVRYDGKGRQAGVGQPVFLADPAVPSLTTLPVMKNETATTFDSMDRVLSVTYPDETRTVSAYHILDSRQNQKATDPRGNITERDTDLDGNILEVRRCDAAGVLLTSASYDYDALSQILSVKDHAGNLITGAYDMVGRRIAFQTPDAGLVTYVYDPAGNLSRETDSVLRRTGKSIQYEYDGLNRLVRIDYPDSTDVAYVYGDPPSAPGLISDTAGRIVSRTDETGTATWEYGKVGETTTMSRTINRLTLNAPDESAVLHYTWDYLGRIQEMIYPDGETVTYGYDYGGQVESVVGVHGVLTTDYVQDIGYDEFGQRVYIRYGGNGYEVETSYTYDPQRRWLSSIHTTGPGSVVYQDVTYSFDPVGNVQGVENLSSTYETRMSYGYDALDQLTHAEGRFINKPSGVPMPASTFTQDFTFSAIGNLTSKKSTQINGTGLSYTLDYSYYQSRAHQPERIGTLWYLYDANGNMMEERQGGHSDIPLEELTLTASGDLRTVNQGFGLKRLEVPTEDVYSRTFQWNEENLLKRSVEGDLSVDYLYGTDGQRAVKYSFDGVGSAETMYFDPMWQVSTDRGDLRQSKHIYVGSTRIATKCGIKGDPATDYEKVNTYYYHSDNIGSAEIVTDYHGGVYEHMEYTPYGELWVEKTSEVVSKTPFRFTGKELDEETGLYYYGARYLNPRTSMWISADPAMEKYLPNPGQKASDLKGMGGAFNTLNFAAYCYAGNNPVRYIDPNGAWSESDAFDTADEAAIAVIRHINPTSKAEIREYGGRIYKDENGKFHAEAPTQGTAQGFSLRSRPALGEGKTLVGDYHTHGNYSKDQEGPIIGVVKGLAGDCYRRGPSTKVIAKPEEDPSVDYFSEGDIKGITKDAKGIKNYSGYLGTPSGDIKKYSPGNFLFKLKTIFKSKRSDD